MLHMVDLTVTNNCAKNRGGSGSGTVRMCLQVTIMWCCFSLIRVLVSVVIRVAYVSLETGKSTYHFTITEN